MRDDPNVRDRVIQKVDSAFNDHRIETTSKPRLLANLLPNDLLPVG